MHMGRNANICRVVPWQNTCWCYDAAHTSVGTLPEGYVRFVPLPRVPVQQSTVPDYYKDQYRVPTYITPHSLVESAAYAFSPAWQAIAINT